MENEERRSRRPRRSSDTDRSEYFRERDRYFAERDRYYAERDKYYDELEDDSYAEDEYAEDDYDDNRYDTESDYVDVDDTSYTSDTPGRSRRRRSRRDSAMNHTGGRKKHSEPQGDSDTEEASDTEENSSYERKNSASDSSGADRNRRKAADKNAAKEKGKDRKKKKHPILIILLLLILALAGFIGYKFVTRQSGYYTVAVFGVDSRNGNVGKDALSDVNIIARVDMATGEIKLVSIYRDTYTQIDSDGNYHKFNEAYFRGGPEQAIWALEHNTDVKIDDYVTFNWKAVVDAINILGGVDIDISDAEFKYINAYITETVNSTGVGSVQLQHAGENHLDGVQAVAYARLRKMDDDYTRTERQRRVISLMLDKAKNADFSVLYNVLVTVLPQTSTSVGISDLLPFAQNISKYYIGETAGFPFDKQGRNIGKLDAVVPVTWESNDIALHEFLYPGQSYSPSSLVQKISAHVAEVSGLGGSGETSVKTDNLGTGSGGSSGGQPAETEAVTQTETASENETESTEESIEEISDPASDEEETDNDSDAEEDIVPEGSNSNVENSRHSTEAGPGSSETQKVNESTKASESSAGPGGSGNLSSSSSSGGPGGSQKPTAAETTAAETTTEAATESYAVISGNSDSNGPGPGSN